MYGGSETSITRTSKSLCQTSSTVKSSSSPINIGPAIVCGTTTATDVIGDLSLARTWRLNSLLLVIWWPTRSE